MPDGFSNRPENGAAEKTPPPADGHDSTTPPRLAQELGDEWVLRGCRRIEHDGVLCPAMGRIPLLEKLGAGGMSVVYRGVHPGLGHDVAVKVLPRSLRESREDLFERFVREARLAARVRSEHLATVYDVSMDRATGMHYLVMEYIRGRNARQWVDVYLERGRTGVGERQALEVAIAATKGLADAHMEGILHRDLKPSNVLIPANRKGGLRLTRAKLVDLGLACVEGPDHDLTQTSAGLGTPGFMAPEQARNAREAGKPADVFGAAAMLYAFLAGQAPFHGKSPTDAILRTVAGEYRLVQDVRPDVSPATTVLIRRALALDPADRFPDAPAFLDALQLCRNELDAGPRSHDETESQIATLAAVPERGKHVHEILREPIPIRSRKRRAKGAHRPARSRRSSGPALAAALVVAAVVVLAIALFALNRQTENPSPAPVTPAVLHVTSHPSGATVMLDGVVRGQTPAEVRDAEGTHTVRIVLDGYAPYVIPDVRIGRGAVERIDASLEPAGAPTGFDITSLPQGAAVFVDGQPHGHTPVFVPDMAPGPHVVRLTLAGYQEWTSRGAVVREGRRSPVHATLSPAVGGISLGGAPPRARLVLTPKDGGAPREWRCDDGGRLSATDLAVGSYELSIEADGTTLRRDVRIKEAEMTVVWVGETKR